MCIRGTVKSDSGHDAILVIQLIGCLCHIHLRCLDRDDGAAVICIFFTDHLYKLSIRIQFQDVFDKVSGQHHFMRKDGFHGNLIRIFGISGSFFQITECSMQSEDSGDIRSSGLESVRKKSRYFFRMGSTSGSAAEQWFDLSCQLIADQEASDSLWCPEALCVR